jgi:hypothetical protein
VLDIFPLYHVVTKQSTHVHADGRSGLQLRYKLLLRNQPAGLGPRGGANRVKKDRVDVGIGGRSPPSITLLRSHQMKAGAVKFEVGINLTQQHQNVVLRTQNTAIVRIF